MSTHDRCARDFTLCKLTQQLRVNDPQLRVIDRTDLLQTMILT